MPAATALLMEEAMESATPTVQMASYSMVMQVSMASETAWPSKVSKVCISTVQLYLSWPRKAFTSSVPWHTSTQKALVWVVNTAMRISLPVVFSTTS